MNSRLRSGLSPGLVLQSQSQVNTAVTMRAVVSIILITSSSSIHWLCFLQLKDLMRSSQVGMLPGITWTLPYIPLGGRGSGGEARGEVESQAHQESYKEKVDYFPETTFYISGESWQSSTLPLACFWLNWYWASFWHVCNQRGETTGLLSSGTFQGSDTFIPTLSPAATRSLLETEETRESSC